MYVIRNSVYPNNAVSYRNLPLNQRMWGGENAVFWQFMDDESYSSTVGAIGLHIPKRIALHWILLLKVGVRWICRTELLEAN